MTDPSLPDDWSWQMFDEYNGRWDIDDEQEEPESPEDYAERLRDQHEGEPYQ